MSKAQQGVVAPETPALQVLPKPAPGSALSRKNRAKRKAEEAARQEEEKKSKAKEQVGVRIDPEIRYRARAAFRHASFHDHVPSFAAFVEHALEQEIKRYEEKFNNGQPFDPDTDHLATGPKG